MVTSWLVISLTAICFLSLVLMVIFQREIRHVANAQIHILSEENEEIVYSKRLKVLLMTYSITMILLVVAAYLLFWMT